MKMREKKAEMAWERKKESKKEVSLLVFDKYKIWNERWEKY